YLLLAFMFFGHISYAQCLIANVNIADCSSCYNGITLLNNDSIQIPKFVVFKESFRADSLEIEKRFKFGQLGFNMLFNNLLYERVQSDNIRSSLTYLDENLEMKWKFDLKFITQETITDSILSISLPIN